MRNLSGNLTLTVGKVMASKPGITDGKKPAARSSRSQSKAKADTKEPVNAEVNEVNANPISTTQSINNGASKQMSDSAPSIITFSSPIDDAVAPDPLPAGPYVGEISGASIKAAAASGNQYLALVVTIPPEQFPADFDASAYEDGLRLTYNRISVEDNAQARWRLKKFSDAVGVVIKTELDPNEFLGRTVNVEVAHGTFEGETRAEIKKIG